MQRPQSINQNHLPDALPNFRSLGVILRALLLVNGVALLAALALASSWLDIAQRMLDISALLQPVLFSSLLLLYAFSPLLSPLPYQRGIAAVVLLIMLVTLVSYHLSRKFYAPLMESGNFHSWRDVLLSAAVAALVLAYFKLRTRALSPALQEARLQALQARIRPHFLFNSINAVLSVVRADPKRAETALEDMADLFRMAMAHSGELVPARREVALARQYLELEKLRLGDRLKVNWRTEELPDDAMLPPLILQPLLENAVYHGIEPLTEGGEIDVRLYRSGSELHLEMYNPRREQGGHHTGNKMALSNIRERLELLFDIEASYTVETGQDFYRVHIVMPYEREEQP